MEWLGSKEELRLDTPWIGKLYDMYLSHLMLKI